MPTTIQLVNSSDTPNQGRTKWNTNDTNLKATADALEAQQAAHVGEGHPSLYYTKTEIDTQQAAQDAALTAHKTSGDHDTRYALLSALLDMVKLTTDQIIDGIKTFLKTIIIKSDTAAIELQKGDGTPKGRFSYDSNSDAISLDVRQQGSWQSLLRTSPNASHVNFPNHEVRSKGKTLATEEYVQARVKSGTITGATVKIVTPEVNDPVTQSDWQIFMSNARVIGFDVVGLLPGGVIQRYSRFNADISTNVIFQYWLQNTSAPSVDLMIVRPEEFAGEPFASRMLYSFNLGDISLPAGTAFYIVPVLSV